MDFLKKHCTDVGLLWLRVLAGCGMAYHGYGKIFEGRLGQFTEGVAAMGFPIPEVFAWAAALSEFAGGICLALGLFTRLSALMILATMSVAAFVAHADDPFQKKELALAYWGVSGALVFLNGGKLSLDYLIQKNKSN